MTKNKDMVSKNTNLKRTGWHPIDVAELERMRQPGYRRINQGLRWNATPTDKAKYEICQSILRYKHENNLSEKEVGKRLGIKKLEQLEYLLFCHLDQFTLDELGEYASKLFGDFKLKIVRSGEEINHLPRYQTKNNDRSRKHL